MRTFKSVRAPSNHVPNCIVKPAELEVSVNGPGIDGAGESAISFGIGARIGEISIGDMTDIGKDDFDATAISPD